MRWFKNLATFTKLLIVFGLLSAIMGGMGWLAISELGTMQTNIEDIYEKQLVPLGILSEIENDLQRIRQDAYKMNTPLTPDELKGVVEDARSKDRDLIANSDKFEATIQSDETRRAFKDFREKMKSYQDYRENEQYPLVKQGEKDKAFQVSLAGGPKYEATYDALKATLHGKQEYARSLYKKSQDVYNTSRQLMLAMLVVGIVLALSMGLMIGRSIAILEKHRRGSGGGRAGRPESAGHGGYQGRGRPHGRRAQPGHRFPRGDGEGRRKHCPRRPDRRSGGPLGSG